MNLSPVVLFSVATLAAAQVPTAVVHPHTASTSSTTGLPAGDSRATVAAAPVLGYLLGPGPADLRAVLAALSSPKLGPGLAAPADTRRLYLPPREEYALVEMNSDAPLAIWSLHKEFTSGNRQEPISISGAISHPDLVGFSPRGSATILYSRPTDALQVISHLPLEPSLTNLPVTNLLTPVKISISDDGDLAVAELTDGTLLSSYKGSAWSPVAAAATPAAWCFIPKTHNLILSDVSKKTINLLPNADGAWKDSKVVAQSVDADQLASTKDGEQLVAAKQGTTKVWTIDLISGTITAHEGKQNTETLLLLRDGFTFLLSASPNVTVVRFAMLGEAPKTAKSMQTSAGQE